MSRRERLNPAGDEHSERWITRQDHLGAKAIEAGLHSCKAWGHLVSRSVGPSDLKLYLEGVQDIWAAHSHGLDS